MMDMSDRTRRRTKVTLWLATVTQVMLTAVVILVAAVGVAAFAKIVWRAVLLGWSLWP